MATWTDRTSPSTAWDDVQFGGTALTWTICGNRCLEWDDMDKTTWAGITATSWSDRSSVSTSWA